MNVALQGMLDGYRPQTLADYENALKEIVQELALLGLWRAKFFEHAAFYGGTALRIFHRLPRFSEDIDFSLLQPATSSISCPTSKPCGRSWWRSDSASAWSAGTSG